ncbi:MAG: tripartite tricarboxylate transporter substrate binding protein [Rhodospirillales bacterium]|nr:tripartite tricarboxylate transporter substrate binding protein [Rhodospirillales bacterium]QQS12970.1 MAG: tripartite tricarboxylate transporter substrate binding protein [Rhodospirillales bacterium]
MYGRRSIIAAAGALAVAPGAARAQEWPARPLKLVVTFPPGGISDVVARLVAPGLTERLGQTVIVDNRPGGGTTIGVRSMLSARDDAHTLLIANSAPISIAPFLFDTPPYDPVKDFTHVAHLASMANAFAVSPSMPVTSMKELVAWIKAQGKPVPFGSGGAGSIGHIVGEMFKSQLGLDMEHIAYKGAAPMFQDMMAGQLGIAINAFPEVWTLAKDGKLRVLALTSTTRPAIAPDVPLVGDLGYPKLVAENFIGVSGPAGMPAAAVARLNKAVLETLADSKVAARFNELGIVSSKMTPAEFTTFVTRQVADFKPAVIASGAKLN